MSASIAPALLTDHDRAPLLKLLESDLPGSLYLRSLVHEFGVAPTERPEHGRFVAARSGAQLTSVLFLGNSRNLTTWGDAAQVESLLEFAMDPRDQPRLFVGPAAHAAAVRHVFARHGSSPFLDREQIYYVLSPSNLRRAPEVAMRRAELRDLDRVARAQAAMTEEDLAIPRGQLDMVRLRELSRLRISLGKVWLMEQDGELVFKTEESARAPEGILVGGVYTPPSLRGRGLATRGLATWAHTLFTEGLETIALHVNAANAPAVAAYERVGFVKHSVLRLMLAY